MLGLATHEPNFTIIREEFKPNKPRPCALCGQVGHEIKDCQGTAREKQGQVSSACTSGVSLKILFSIILIKRVAWLAKCVITVAGSVFITEFLFKLDLLMF